MNLQSPLTKENFWNDMMKQFPKATKLFCDWIDEYKKAVYWDLLFCNQSYIKPTTKFIKFHDIPHAMQQGIWIEFIRQNLSDYFEQVERHMSEFYDFEEDVKTVFAEIEPLTE